jgi:hypothetical protein
MRRFRRTRRGVLEGLPLTLIISVVIVAIGTAILLGLFYYSQSNQLGSLAVSREANQTAVQGWLPLWKTPMPFWVLALSQSHGALRGVQVEVNGSGIDELAVTGSNGSAYFTLPPPLLPEHATSGTLAIVARYDPPATFAPQPTESLTLSEVILG